MANMTFKDRDRLYERAIRLTELASELDVMADQMTRDRFGEIAIMHRKLARDTTALAKLCREWADGVTGD